MRILCVIGLAAACGGKVAAPAVPKNTGGITVTPAAYPTAVTRVFDFSEEMIVPDPNGVDSASTSPPDPPDKASIRRAMRRHNGLIAHCLSTDPTARGTIELVFGISAAGQIGDVYINGQGGEAMRSCIATIVKSMVFAPDPNGFVTEVHYPIDVQRGP
jgi:hypothetical protein